MSQEERERGKQLVQQMLADLCGERNITLTSPVVWHKDFDRMRYWLEVDADGRNVKWPLSYEQLEDCVADETVRKAIETGLAQYVLSAAGKSLVAEPRGIRCIPSTDPLIVVDFDCHRERPIGSGFRVVRDNEFILKNKGDADAINVRIDDIVLASGVATFKSVTEIARGKECSVKATVPMKGNLLQHDWEDVLMDEWNSKGSLEDFAPVPVTVHYSDYRGNQYQARFEVAYNVYAGTAETRFLDCFKLDKGESIPADKHAEHHSPTPGASETADVFISHDSEDKPYVEPLVIALQEAGITVWYDRFTLEWGDSLRTSIDRGLVDCKFGIVVLSKAFLRNKKWTRYELDGLFARETADNKVILPIWHGVTHDDLIAYGPAFADRLAKVSSKDDHADIVRALLKMLGRTPTTSAAVVDAPRVEAEGTPKQAATLADAQRAWLIEEINFPKELPLPSREAGASATLTLAAFRVVNRGNTMARIREVKLNFHLMRSDLTLAKEPDYGATNRLPELGDDGWLIAPGQHINLHVYLSSGNLTEQDALQIRIGTFTLITYGIIEYETLGMNCVNQFCYMWHEPTGLVTDADVRGFRRSGPVGYNRKT